MSGQNSRKDSVKLLHVSLVPIQDGNSYYHSKLNGSDYCQLQLQEKMKELHKTIDKVM